MQPQTTTAPSGAYMQSRVQYFGKTMFGGSLSLLEWSGDGHIRLFSLDPATGQSAGVIFDCTSNQVGKAKATLTILTLRIDSKAYSMDFSTGVLPWMMTGGLLGIFMASKITQQSGIQWWVDNLRTQGVTVKQYSVWKRLRLMLFVSLGFIVLVFVVVILTGGSK